MDDLDRRLFVFQSEVIPGWRPLDGWTGIDIDDPDAMYSLETATRGPEVRGLIHKLVKIEGSRVPVLPVPVPSDAIKEAVDHLGFSRFRTKLVEDSPSQTVWIINEH